MTLTLRSPPNLRRYTPYFVGLFVISVALYALAALGNRSGTSRPPGSDYRGDRKNAENASGRAPIWALIRPNSPPPLFWNRLWRCLDGPIPVRHPMFRDSDIFLTQVPRTTAIST